MGKLTFQAALGGTVDLVGPNTASTVTLNLPATSGDIVGTGSTGVITTGMISGQIAVAQGGTGSATAQTAINTLAGAVTSGSYLRGNGTNVVMSTIQGADVPTLNQNTTGTAAGLSSILAVASGGTGTSTPALVAGTNVTITGTWPNQTINSTGGGSGMVYPGAGIPNSTGSAWGTSYSVTGTGAVVLDTRPTITAPRIDSINGTTNSANAAVLGLNNIVTGTGLSSALQITNNAYNSNNPVILKIINTNGIVSQNLELSGANTGKVAINNGGDATVQLILNSAGANATSTTITASQTASRVLTLPDATDTLVGKATTDTLTNKTISGSSNTITNVSLTSGVTGTLPVANGGTNQTSYTDGQLLIGNSTGNTLAKATLTAGSGISITNGAGSITIAATGGAGTVTSVAQSFTGGLISVGGSPITSSGTLALTVAGTSGGIPYFSSASTWATSAALASNALVIGGGAGAAPATTTTGTGVITALGNATNAASGIVVKDANSNIAVNSISEGFVNVAAAGTTTVLTVSSQPSYVVTGSGGQTYQLPDATTLPNGVNYLFNNNQSSGTIVVKNNSSTTLATIQSGGYVEVILLSNATAAGTWDVHNQAPTNVSWSTNTFSYPGSITSATWNGNTVGILYGGTNTTATPTAGTVVYGTGTAQAYTAAGTTGQVLTSNGASAPTWTTVSGTGTVTSVAATVPAFLSISGSPITTSGTLAISYSGTALPVANGGTGTTTGSLVNCTVDGTNAVGYLNVPQNAQTGAYTLVLADGGKHIYHASGSAAATYTIPAASSVAFPIGTVISFVNLATAAVTISITTDTMYLSSAGTTGSRTLAQYGIATATKVSGVSSAGIWVISGAGLT